MENKGKLKKMKEIWKEHQVNNMKRKKTKQKRWTHQNWLYKKTISSKNIENLEKSSSMNAL